MPLTFSYRVPATRLVLGLLFCLAFAAGMGYVALTNREGLILLRVLTFSPTGATVAYWSFATLLLVAAAMFCVLLVRTWKGAVSIVVDEKQVIAPAASLKGELLSIPFSAISALGAHKIQGQEFVTINSSIGQARVMGSGFRSAEEFEKFKRALAERAKR